MTIAFKARMSAIIELTKAGKLEAAVKAIQATLSGSPITERAGSEPAPTIDMVPPATSDGAWTLPLDAVKPGAPAADAGLSGLADALAGLWKLRQPVEARPTDKASPDGRFTTHHYKNAAGARSYKLYVPPVYNGKPVPLIVMLHGCTQSADDFATGTRMNALADEFGFLVAYPEQTSKANSSKCWNWFNAADQQRDQGEPSIIAGLTREIMANYAVDPKKIFAAGLSAGGAAAAVLGQTYPDLYAAVGIHSGLACGVARDMMSAFGVMKTGSATGSVKPAKESKTRAIVFHGDKDQTVHPLNGDRATAQFMGTRTSKSVTEGEASGARFTRTTYSSAAGRTVLEQWRVHGAGHAWSGGNASGSYTSIKGPDASREMVRFFLEA